MSEVDYVQGKRNNNFDCIVVYSSETHVRYIKNILYHVEHCLTEKGYNYIILGDNIRSSEEYLTKLKSIIAKSVLGIVILDGLRPNVTFELGMLIALEKCIILLMSKNAKVSIKTFYKQSENLNNCDSGLTQNKFKNVLKNPPIDMSRHLSDYYVHIAVFNHEDPDEMIKIINDELKKTQDCIKGEIEQSRDHAKSLGNQELILEKEIQMGKFLINNKNYQDALDIFKNKLENSQNMKNSLKFIILYHIGRIYHLIEEFGKARMMFDEAKRIGKLLGNNIGKENILNDIKRYSSMYDKLIMSIGRTEEILRA